MSPISAAPAPSRIATPAVRAADMKSPVAHTPAFLQHLDAATQKHDDDAPDRGRSPLQRDQPDRATGPRGSLSGHSPKVVVAANKQPSAAGHGASASTASTSAVAEKSASLPAASHVKPPAESKDSSTAQDKSDTTDPTLVNTMLALINPAAPTMADGNASVEDDAAGAEAKTSAAWSAGASGLLSLTIAGSALGAAATAAEGSLGSDGTADSLATNAATLPVTELGGSVSAALGPMLAASQTLGLKPLKELDSLQQSLAMLAPATQGSAAPLTIQALQLPSTVNAQAFQQQLGQQVAWLSGQEIKQASIRLHPADLGQLDIKVSVNQGQVNVVFNAQHPAAVTAVQQTLPQLGHMLAQHGLALGHAEVGQHGSGNPSGQGHAGANDGVASVQAGSSESTGTEIVSVVAGIGLLDAFA